MFKILACSVCLISPFVGVRGNGAKMKTTHAKMQNKQHTKTQISRARAQIFWFGSKEKNIRNRARTKAKEAKVIMLVGPQESELSNNASHF